MFEDTRWAARFQFLEELWRRGERVIVDGELEATLRDGGPGVAHGSHPPLAELVDELIPRQPEAHRVWMGVATSDLARELERHRGGTRFVPVSQVSTLLRTESWDVAIIDLGPFVQTSDDQPDDGEASRKRDRSGRFLPKGASTPAREGELDELGSELLATVAEAQAQRSCTVVLSFPARDYPARPHGFSFEEVSNITAAQPAGGSIYGVFSPPMSALVAFGPVSAVDAGWGGDEDEGEDEENDDPYDGTEPYDIGASPYDEDPEDVDEVELVYDNSLGSQAPLLSSFVVVLGAPVRLGDGLTLIELAPNSSPSATAAPDASGMRAQVVEARRRLDLAEIDRQRLVGEVDGLAADRERLEDEVADLRDRLARAAADGEPLAVVPSPTAAAAPVVDLNSEDRLDRVLTREQSVRWQLTQAQRELEAARKRPVEDLEAELARLRDHVGPSTDPLLAPKIPVGAGEPTTAPVVSTQAAAVLVRPTPPSTRGVDHTNPRQTAAREHGARALERLVRRVERGGIGVLELRRELVAIRRLLRS